MKILGVEFVREVYQGWRDWFAEICVKINKRRELNVSAGFEYDIWTFGADISFTKRNWFSLNLYLGPLSFGINVFDRFDWLVNEFANKNDRTNGSS